MSEMDVGELEKRCYFYQKMGLAEKEKELLKQGLSQQWDWSWGLNRMRVLDPSYDPEFDFENFVPEPDVYPETQQEILQYSRQYQEEWRFEREYRLIEHALKLFPSWHYLHERKEWHSRPIFHRDPEKSRVQPRKPLHLPRDPNYIPKQETIDSMCFVTASGSDQPYFDLSIQLLESIKATRWYNHVPIKVLDCGLTHEDAEYIRHRFNAEVKDPGWDVDPDICYDHKDTYRVTAKEGWKGMLSRPYIVRHFPGYNYYFWIDTDAWTQDEYGLDHLVTLAEQYGIGAVSEDGFVWPDVYQPFLENILKDHLSILNGHALLHNGMYCMRCNYAEQYMYFSERLLEQLRKYTWGFDMSSFNIFYYESILRGVYLTKESSSLVLPHKDGLNVGTYGVLYRGMSEKAVGIVGMSGNAKSWGYRLATNIHHYFSEGGQWKPYMNNEDILNHYLKSTGAMKFSFMYRCY